MTVVSIFFRIIEMADESKHDAIAVVDFGGQYAHMIASKLRKYGYHALIMDPNDETEAFATFKGVILSGSPGLISEGDGDDWNKAIFEVGCPLLGLCFGHQQMAHYYGGKVESAEREYGPATLCLAETVDPMFKGVDVSSQVFMSHGDSVVALAPGFVELAYTKKSSGDAHHFAAVGDAKRKRYGFQFHPEVDDTKQGEQMLRNFANEICGCKETWDMKRFFAEEKARIQKQCEGKEVFLLASGGVDSTVCAWMIHEALGPERLHLLHIDNGFMRLNESKQVIQDFKEHDVSRHVHFVDATDTFLEAVGKTVAPERKRLAIGNKFIDVFQEQAAKLGLERFLLAQGTIYPDTIESGGTKRSATIKTHHNRVPIIQKMIDEGKVIEPIAELYKAEVRELGLQLGISPKLIWRHPYPGPGLGVRLLCSTGQAPDNYDVTAINKIADPIVGKFGFKGLPLPCQSVGVKGDVRCYDLPLMLLSSDYKWQEAVDCALDVFKGCTMINRCILNLGPVPTSSSPVEAYTTRKRLDTLRLADDAVMRGLERHDIYSTIWQCPTVLVPVSMDNRPGELIVIRPIISERAMTAMPFHLPKALCDELVTELMAIEGVSGVALDVTPKPPGTIEWE
uniref:GMP synthase (glutamine-hydrolyzing) n=1 Tax=Eutreptiella gymnastica TaxID=73025 RepID=A0A7S1IJ62_9EUGL